MKRKIVALVALLAFCSFGVSANAAGLRDIFNAKYYADQYKDLQDAFGYDEEALYNHYLTYGINEGRTMNPIIDVVKYREGYEDLDTAFGDNWDAYVDHYFTYGINEKRDNGTDFDIVAYVEAYDDIEEAFGNDFVAIAEHYQTFGINENRQEASKVYQEVRRQEEIREQEELRRQEEENATSTPTPVPDVSDEENEGRVETVYFENGHYMIKEYNALGDLIKETGYDQDGILFCVYEYENGRNVKNTFYNPDGSVKNYDETYYDENGKILKWIVSGIVDGLVVVEYNQSEKMSKSTYYDYDGNLTKWFDYFYNEAGNLVKEIGYNADGNIIYLKETTYDEVGQIIETKATAYYPDGSVEWIEQCDAEGNLIMEAYYYNDGSKSESYYLATGELVRNKYYYSDGRWDENVYDTEHAELDEESPILLQSTRYNANGNMYNKEIYEYHYGDTVGSVYRIKATIYDATGARIVWTYAEGDVLTCCASYDAQGNLIYEKRYDAEGNII